MPGVRERPIAWRRRLSKQTQYRELLGTYRLSVRTIAAECEARARYSPPDGMAAALLDAIADRTRGDARSGSWLR